MASLEVRVGEPVRRSLVRAAKIMQAIQDGREVAPHFSVGFRSMAQFGEVFTPKRWELIEALKAEGPMTIYALAKHLGRHYRNVHKDVAVLVDWTVVGKNKAGRVFVPWDEIDVRMPLNRAA